MTSRSRRATCVLAALATIGISVTGLPAVAAASTTEIDPGGFTPSSVAVDPNTGRSFALDPSDGSITIIDTASGTIEGELGGFTSRDYGEAFLAIDPVLGHIYTAGAREKWGARSYLIDVQDQELGAGSLGRTFELANQARPTAIAIDPFTHRAFVTTVQTSGPLEISRLMRIDGAYPADETPAPVAITRLPNGVVVDSIAIDPLLRQVYLANSAIGSVSVIDEVTGGYKSGDIAVGGRPKGLAVDTYTHEVFVADAARGTVHVIDGYTRAATGSTIAVGGTPDEVDIDQLADRLYVKQDPAEGGGSVGVYVSSTHAEVTRDLGLGPVGEVAVDHLTHTLVAPRTSGSSIAVVKE
ncbi:YncE family protein [Herbiconiux sp. P15]|uniref:YncE family protein n=1 Tax=Herbiconiux liukaitaii TaxID=3342799 RepID=UPI0035B750D6